jgi:hypothetical protein
MATKIILKKTAVAGRSPVSNQVDQAELAINLVDRKIFTKDNSNNIVELTGAYVSTSAPASPAEGDVWYDSTNNVLKVYDGSAFQSAGYQNLSDLEDVTLSSITANDVLTWNGSAFVNTANVTHNNVTMTGVLNGPSSFTIDPATHGDNTGTVVIAGNLTVNGTTTTVNSNQVDIGDSVILLNSDEVGTPSQNGGFEIERGTLTNVSFLWDEGNDYWTLGDKTLANVALDGGSY